MSDQGAPDAASSRVKLIETGFQTLSDDKISVTAELSYAFDLSDFIQSGRQFVMTFSPDPPASDGALSVRTGSSPDCHRLSASLGF